MSFVELLRSRQCNSHIYLVNATEDNKPAWYYLWVEKFTQPLFEKKLGPGTLNLNEYGKMLDSGWGKEPPEGAYERVKAALAEQARAEIKSKNLPLPS